MGGNKYDLSSFAGHRLTEFEVEEILKNNEMVETTIHKIPVNGGYLRVRVEDGVPTITYMSDCGLYVVEMLSSNSLRFLNIKKGV